MAEVTHLLDTHAVVWAMEDSPRLGKKARRIIEQAVWGTLAISDMTLLELAMLVQRGKVLLTLDLQEALLQAAEEFMVLPIGPQEAEIAVTLNLPHADPFDRIIVATAHTHQIPLLTADRTITHSNLVETAWA